MHIIMVSRIQFIYNKLSINKVLLAFIYDLQLISLLLVTGNYKQLLLETKRKLLL